jgi:hypothetical protein
LPPVVVMKPVELATVRLAGALAPGVTLSVPPVRFEVRVNVSVVAETVRLTVAGLVLVPEVPVTVTVVVAADMLAAVAMVN